MTTTNRDQAHAIWRAADALRLEAAQHRNEAKRLDDEARKLDGIASALADGRPVSDAI